MGIPRGARVTLGLLLGAPATAFAADPEVLPTLGQATLRAVAALGLVLVLIVLLAYLFKRLRQSSPVSSNHGPVASVARLDLGGRREIRLVRVGDRQLVVGITSGRIDLLSEQPAPSEVPRADTAEASPRHPALEVLRKLASS